MLSMTIEGVIALFMSVTFSKKQHDDECEGSTNDIDDTIVKRD